MFNTTATRAGRSTPSSYYRRPKEARCVHPHRGEFTWVNQGTATATDGKQGIILNAPAVASNAWRMLMKPAPKGKFSAVARFSGFIANANTVQPGLVFRNSSNGRLLAWTPYVANNLAFARWTNESTFSANVATMSVWGGWPWWLRMDSDGATVNCYISRDGLDWSSSLTSDALSSFLTAAGGSLDQVGVGVQVNNGPSILAWQSFQIGQLPT